MNPVPTPSPAGSAPAGSASDAPEASSPGWTRPVDAPQPSRHPRAAEPSGWRGALQDIVGLDLRSLGLMRILLGLMLLLDVLIRSTDAVAFYSDQGVFPRAALLEFGWYQWRYSLHMGTGEPAVIRGLFVLQGIFAVMLMVGYRTRLATIASWIFVISLHARAGLLLQAGDIVIRLVLFWSMFLPLGDRFSVDALSRPVPAARPRLVTSVASFGFILQLSYMYVFTAILKSGGVWHNGQAVYYALMLDHYVKQPQTSIMLQFPKVMQFFTGATLVLEYAGPPLLLSPVWRGPLRTLVCFSFIGLHMGFFFFMELGFFPWICALAWVGVLPGWFWSRFSDWKIERVAPPRRDNIAVNAFMALCVVIVTWWNLSTIHKQTGTPMPVHANVRWLGNLLRLDQKWDMFAPYPMKDDGWYALPGRLANGEWVELWRNEPVQWVPLDTSDGHTPVLNDDDPALELARFKPEEASSEFKSQRWRKYMRNIWMKENKKWRLHYGRYVCREWNNSHRGMERLKSFRLVYIKEVTPKPGRETKLEPVVIWTHDCFRSNDEVKAKNESVGKPAPEPAPAVPASGPKLPLVPTQIRSVGPNGEQLLPEDAAPAAAPADEGEAAPSDEAEAAAPGDAVE